MTAIGAAYLAIIVTFVAGITYMIERYIVALSCFFLAAMLWTPVSTNLQSGAFIAGILAIVLTLGCIAMIHMCAYKEVIRTPRYGDHEPVLT